MVANGDAEQAALNPEEDRDAEEEIRNGGMGTML